MKPAFRHHLERAAILPCVAALLAWGPNAMAAEVYNSPILTDRPSFIPSSSTLAEKKIQVETSIQRLQDGQDAAKVSIWTTPTLMRFGMPGGYELRAETDAFSHVRTFTAVEQGFSDLQFGMKGRVPQSWNPKLSMAWLLQAAFPTGSEDLGTKGVRPSIQLTSHWQLPNNTSLGFMPGVRMDEDQAGERYANGMLAVNVAHDWNPQINSYAQMAGRELRSADRGGKLITWDLGAAWKLMRETQLDGAVGFGLKENDPDFQWTIGVSQRFTPPMPEPYSAKP